MRRIPSLSLDEPLVVAAKAGDKIAYGRLVELHQSPVRGFLRQLTKQDFGLADDLAQDAFLLAYQRIETFRQDASFKSWVTSIAYKLFLQSIRKDKRRKALLTASVPVEDQFDNIAQCDDKIDINWALEQLKHEERTAIRLHHHQGMSHQEIAEIMQMPLGTIKSHISRGRENLKALLTNPSNRRKS